MGIFTPFLDRKGVKLVGVEAGGLGLSTDRHGASLCRGRTGVLHGSKSFVLQDASGQIREAHSISAGLDYPGVGPEHAFLKSTGRAVYVAVTDREALEGFDLLSQWEGILPALESSHAVAYGFRLARKMRKTQSVVINLSGRGDKDIAIVAEGKGTGRVPH